MAIKITENGVVRYENEPNVDRLLFPNIPEGGGSPEQIAQAVADWFEDHPVVQDVQVGGTSILDSETGIANVPVASSTKFGAVKAAINYGLDATTSGLRTYPAGSNLIKLATGAGSTHQPITPYRQHESVFYGLAKAADHDEKDSTLPIGTYTEDAKSAISEMLGGSVAVSGTAPTINAKAGIRYVCGEVLSLDITLPESGVCDVVFTSGSTPTVLTITPPTGQTVKWANEFDPTNLEADTVYEINIMDGLGVAVGWT